MVILGLMGNQDPMVFLELTDNQDNKEPPDSQAQLVLWEPRVPPGRSGRQEALAQLEALVP